MTVKEELHRLVDQLPEEESEAAVEVLKQLCERDAASVALRQAQPDKDPLGPEEARESESALKSYREGKDRGEPLDKVRRELL